MVIGVMSKLTWWGKLGEERYAVVDIPVEEVSESCTEAFRKHTELHYENLPYYTQQTEVVDVLRSKYREKVGRTGDVLIAVPEITTPSTEKSEDFKGF